MMSAKMITLAIDAVVLYSMNELRMPGAKAARTVPLMCCRAADHDDEEGVDQVGRPGVGACRPDEKSGPHRRRRPDRSR